MAPKLRSASKATGKKLIKEQESSPEPLTPTTEQPTEAHDDDFPIRAQIIVQPNNNNNNNNNNYGYWPRTDNLVKSIILLTLLGIYSYVSPLALSPVFGSIPASVHHNKLSALGCFLGWAGNLWLRRTLPVKTEFLLPILVACIPVVQFHLCGWSEQLGPRAGPVVVEGLTFLPLTILSAACVADYLDGLRFERLPPFVSDAVPGLAASAMFKLAEDRAAMYLGRVVGSMLMYTRVGLQVLLAGCFSLFAPSRYLLFALPALLHTTFFNTHFPTSMATASLNSTLASDGWFLLDRRESITGYISVIESENQGFRVMRCDHSLLGGEWVMHQGLKVAEPVFGVFVMLEAVRLVEREKQVRDVDAKALVVGLGVGTTPSAFVTHGIDTTVVEIDPVVHEFAVSYFNLKENHNIVNEDAVSYAARLAKLGTTRFDYIVHDVFTGGAEPVDLFTLEFLQNLASLLEPSGVIAINYAGDFTLPAPKIVFRTILSVFPTCRIFRESPVLQEHLEAHGVDFTNMVFFCTKQAERDLVFRPATAGDILGSVQRERFLEPRYEVNLDEYLSGSNEKKILTQKNTEMITKWHQTSAIGHWAIMRQVITPYVWEQW